MGWRLSFAKPSLLSPLGMQGEEHDGSLHPTGAAGSGVSTSTHHSRKEGAGESHSNRTLRQG